MRKVSSPFILLIAFMMIVGLACMGSSGATQQPVVTEAPKATEPPQPTAVVTESPTEPPAAPAGLVSKLQDVKNAVIQIESQGTFVDPQVGVVVNGAGRGSGFIIDPSGLAITNNHVVTGSALLKVWLGGDPQPHNARVLGVSECSDLAVIDIDGDGYPYLKWFDGPVDVGTDMYVAGFPLGDPEYTLTKGVISKAKADGETSWASVNSVIEYDANTNPGNSGGPVITPDGQVMGVHYAGNSQTRQAFGISRDIAKGVIDELKTGKNVDTIGINGQAVSNDDGSLTGVWVSSVQSGSPADKAGVKPADIITNMENLVLATDGTMADYCDILRSHTPGNALEISVVRWPTGEVLEGQLNGRELAVTGTFDAGNTGNANENTNTSSGGTTTSGSEVIDLNASASGDTIYFTDFDGTMDNWTYFLMNGNKDGFTANAEDNKLKVDISQTNTWVYFENDAVSVDNVRLDTVADNLGANLNNVSLFCRYSESDGWYEFNIANNGEWWIYRYDVNSSKYVQLYSGGSTAIHMGKDTNEYSAVCDGDNLTLYINGVQIHTVKDKNLKSGLAGLSLSSFNVTPVTVDFDSFTMSVP